MTNLNEIGALILRLALGTMFIAHAMLKIVVFTAPGTVAFFVSQGFPAWTAYAVIAAELVAGALLVLGIQVRLVALAMLPTLIGALTVHLGNGWVFSAPNGGWEYPAYLVVLALVQALVGPGAYAVRLPFRGSQLAHA